MLLLRRRLPRSWRRGNDVERFLYNATHYFAVGLAGFAVAGFFVSFAWLDILYIMAALMTGLYVSVRGYQSAQSSAIAGGDQPSVPVRSGGGWRVRASVARFAAPGTLRPPARPA
jgi:hypothetical protein